ncbi:MAG: helix-turn-helix domain-containing protein [Spirochaetaceae bacterium]|jgi:transcriptional regulator with XRE-family HTH domain|nr:helix-turn-helix domain-containing protein [Spirochaetaceae bacterium]
MNIKSSFGENLKFYRKEKHLSQEELSERVGISVKHLSSIERGLTFVSAELLEKLTVSLDIPVFCLFVKQNEIVYNDTTLNMIDRVIEIIENHLMKTIEVIKSDIRKNDNN